ncbi:MAG: metallophosphoesterase, partial [Myxococcota bacterium]|nr:metallophosphoesterase [Myxococcota bacterium]
MSWFQYIQTMRSASGNGFFFPSVQPAFQAPLGSQEMTASGMPWTRIRSEVSWFRITTHRCPFPNIQRPIRILHLTDVHIRNRSTWLQALCDLISPIQSDIVVLTGDIVTRGWTEEAVEMFFRACPKGKLATLATMGNWEYWSGIVASEWKTRLQKHDISLLINEWSHLEMLSVIGTDDHLAGSANPKLDQIKNKPCLALTHSPAYFDQLQHPQIHLTLSGHSHGGQIRLPFLKAL